MNPKLPRVSGRELVTALEKAGFRVTHVRGSHHVLRRVDGLRTVVPVHAGQTIGPGLLAKILRQAKLSADQFRELL
jgi:predicted RNA binding protein YcfA (HicA-like mRNA interferase family)